MSYKPMSLDHVNIFVRNAERSHRWYTEVLGLHTQDTFNHSGTQRLRAAFLACDPGHAHDIALFEVGDDAAGPQKTQVGLNHVAWRMASLDDHAVSIGVYFSDPDGNGLEVYYELPRSQWHQERPFSGGGAKGRFPGPWDEALRQATPALTNV